MSHLTEGATMSVVRVFGTKISNNISTPITTLGWHFALAIIPWKHAGEDRVWQFGQLRPTYVTATVLRLSKLFTCRRPLTAAARKDNAKATKTKPSPSRGEVAPTNAPAISADKGRTP